MANETYRPLVIAPTGDRLVPIRPLMASCAFISASPCYESPSSCGLELASMTVSASNREATV